MNRLTPEQRFQIVQFYFENNGFVRNTYRTLRPFYRRQNRPSEQLIRLTMERFRTTFSLIDNSHPQRRRTVRTEEAIATVERSTGIGSVSIHFMEDFAEGSWFANLQNPTRARIEAKRSSSKV
ncbi:DUF4817 domain-containing protein [Trichonephila clavipes]|nr:DUF4817 domain-containing protein [Trichonephila clavipes]